MAVFVNLNFGTQLNIYVDDIAERQTRRIAPVLQSYYATTGNWDNVDKLLKGEVELKSQSNVREKLIKLTSIHIATWGH